VRRRRLTTPAWVLFAGMGVLCAVVFIIVDRPWLQAAVQIPVYVAAAFLLLRSGWRQRHAGVDPIYVLMICAFFFYFTASIAGVVVPLSMANDGSLQVPSLLDGLFLTSYGLLALLLWRLGSRSTGTGRRDGLDTLIVAGGLAPVFWVFLIAPVLAAGRLSLQLATFAAYPTCVFVLCGMTIRLALVARRATAPHMLLGGWIVLELLGDIVFLAQTVNGSYVYGAPWQALWILSATCIGALALHPQNAVLLERRASIGVDGAGRLYVLGASMSVPMLTVAYVEVVKHGARSYVFLAILSMGLVGLIIRRLSGLMVDNAAQQVVQDRLERLSESLAYEALHDPLTGLGNRVLFAERADLALSKRHTEATRGAVIVLLDLDDFKTINDTFGHEAGDRVLVEVSRRLEHVSRAGEAVSRLGGDEFAFVLAEAVVEDALHLSDRIATALATPFDLGPRIIRPMASIGIAIALDGQDRNTLLSEADMAMYEAKSHSPKAPSVFDPVLHGEALSRNQLERDLREAVERGELRVLYQPIVRLATNDIVGVEALIRWEHPTRGTISPLQFIPLAEANGSILDIGDWVLDEAIRQLQRWDDADTGRRLYVSVNVSPRQLGDPGFVARTAAVLQERGIAGDRINLEITEAAFGSDIELMIARLHELKALGLTLAIDDFGTDYSSLSHLRRLPFDVLKIDKSFVDGIATEPAEWALTTAIIRLADSLKKTTVAEGIETGGQLAHLRSLNVELGQGYLFARPLPPEAITELVGKAPGEVFLVG
jgi:diguanylate cyclase (GGDEF)-like protein